MSVTTRGTADELEPLVVASQAEGWNITKLAAEVGRGEFERPGTALFGLYGSTLPGVCGFVRDLYLEGRPEVGRLRHLYVLPEHRGRGVATALVTTVTEAARRHDRLLRLRTQPDAARFYERSGFSTVREPTATHVLEP